MILSTTTFGCGNKHAEESETRSSNAKPAGGAADDHRAADDKATEDLQARRAEEAKATEAKAAADTVAVTGHKVTQDQLQARFDAADRRLNTLNEKVASTTGTKNKKATSAVAVARTHEAAVMAGIANLRETSLAGWDAAKVQVDSDAAALDKALGALEATLQ